ncbi:hypothetical protein PYCC9005_005865 [Savitreella phatthalungensis]
MDTADYLASRVRELLADKPHNELRPRVIIALAGVPGSGKTTLAAQVAALLGPKTAVVGMDGYHIPRSQLDEDGLRRRGAPFTFDAQRVVDLVHQLKVSTYRNLPDIRAPSFDHAVKDPIEDDVVIDRRATVVILEGNYLLLREEPWRQISEMVDETWLLRCDPEIARQRLAARHLAAGIVDSLEEGLARVDFNDAPNGKYLLEHGVIPDVVVDSKER